MKACLNSTALWQ